MTTSLGKVRSGDPLVIPAATFNTFIDAARDFQERQRNTAREAAHEQRDTGIVLIRNESGADRARFDVLGISGPIIEPVDNADGFMQRVVLKGVVPSAPHVGKFAILLEPAREQTIVRACLAGVTVVRVRMRNESHTHADVSAGQANELASGASGSARLLWIEPIDDRQLPDLAWAVVRLGDVAETFRLVKVKKDGGSAGSASAACSLTYSVFDQNANVAADTPLATGLSPMWRRAALGAYLIPSDGTYGIAFYHPADGALTLLKALREVEDVEACT